MGSEMLLLPLTPLYAGVVRARAAAYRHGLLRRHLLERPVVSVGNLTFGGTGKTPTVIALVRDLVRRGRRPAVLTRGYGRRGRDPVVAVGPGMIPEARTAGDEPVEMARRLPGVPIVVDEDRVRGGREAVARGADVLVLDDGFQHLRVARDLDLLVVDAGDPWGGGHLPPRGRLREPLSAMARATAVLVTKLGDDPGPLAAIRDTVQRLAPGIPVLGARLEPTRLVTPEGVLEPAALAGRRVLAFAGLGRPEGFREQLERLGAVVVGTRWFADHHRYGDTELADLVAEAERLDAVPVTTAKDAARLRNDAPVQVLEVEMVPLQESWEALWAAAPEVLP